MKPGKTTMLSKEKKIMGRIYLFLFILMGFTGFGQMPIFKRYYLADIPGLGWTADFYMTHMLHYLGAVLFLGIIAYVISDYLLSIKKGYALTFSAYIRIIFLAGIVVTGTFGVLKNQPDIIFSPNFIIFIDISHLVFMMLYIFSALFFLIIKSGWLKTNVSKI